jgi:protein-tyrosine phosphatase
VSEEAIEAPEREIRFERVFNFRDLGGHPTVDGRTTRWRTLFRSDAMYAFSDRDRRRLSDELGVRTVVDLRDPGSVKRGPANVDAAVTVHHVQFMDDAALRAYGERWGSVPSTGWYLDVLRSAEELGNVRRAFEIFSRPETYPAVFNCSLGKDRAGLVAALVLATLGVDDAVTIADYERSALNMGPIKERAERGRAARASNPLALTPLKPESFHAEGPWMQGVLDTLRERHGSVRGYIEAQGVSNEALDRFADLLLE